VQVGRDPAGWLQAWCSCGLGVRHSSKRHELKGGQVMSKGVRTRSASDNDCTIPHGAGRRSRGTHWTPAGRARTDGMAGKAEAPAAGPGAGAGSDCAAAPQAASRATRANRALAISGLAVHDAPGHAATRQQAEQAPQVPQLMELAELHRGTLTACKQAGLHRGSDPRLGASQGRDRIAPSCSSPRPCLPPAVSASKNARSSDGRCDGGGSVRLTFPRAALVRK